MWRIYYFPESGIIKYQINIEAASQLEPMPFIDLEEKIDVNGKCVDLETKTIVSAEAPPKVVPSFNKTNTRSIRELAALLNNKP